MITIDTKAAGYSRTSSPPTTSTRYVNWSSGGTAMRGQRLLGLLATATAVVLTVSGCSQGLIAGLGASRIGCRVERSAIDRLRLRGAIHRSHRRR